MERHPDTELVIDVSGLARRFESGRRRRRRVVDALGSVDLAVAAGERVAFIGPNGAGKSTLLDLIAKRTQPAGGEVVWGTTVQLGYYRQAGNDLDPNARVREVVAGPDRKPDWTDARLAALALQYHDLRPEKSVFPKLGVASVVSADEAEAGIAAYAEEVRARSFPAKEHTFADAAPEPRT